MVEALTILVAIGVAIVIIIAIIFGVLIALGVHHERLVAAFYAERDADLRAENELQRLVAGKGEGREPVHTHFDTSSEV